MHSAIVSGVPRTVPHANSRPAKPRPSSSRRVAGGTVAHALPTLLASFVAAACRRARSLEHALVAFVVHLSRAPFARGFSCTHASKPSAHVSSAFITVSVNAADARLIAF